MATQKTNSENRTFDQIKEHYEIEKELASKLRVADRGERKYLYTSLYNQLFKQVPHHPQLTRKADPEASAKKVAQKMRLLSDFLKPESIFIEVGPGDCKLAFEVANQVQKVYAIDVSPEIVKHFTYPANFELIISDGSSIPVKENSVTVAYSDQLMEHLHPEDAFTQIKNIYKALSPGGVYICVTPNRLSGPHDVSQYFDEVATGFHLQEYTNTELSSLFSDVGFSKMITYIGGKGVYLRFPLFLIKYTEKIINAVPLPLRKKISKTLLIRAILGIIIVATK